MSSVFPSARPVQMYARTFFTAPLRAAIFKIEVVTLNAGAVGLICVTLIQNRGAGGTLVLKPRV